MTYKYCGCKGLTSVTVDNSVVTDGGMMVFLHPYISVLLSVCIMALQSSRESYILLPLETMMLARLGQSENT